MLLLNSLSLDKVYLALGCLVPGMIVLFVRSQFVRGQRPHTSSAILHYFSVSIIYFAVALPFSNFWTAQPPQSISILSWLMLIFVGPVILGILLGVNIQKDLVRRLLEQCKLKVVHSVPTAWDWKFAALNEQWVLVTLKDGTRFGGYYGPDSFASSDPKERDIYIQWIYDINDPNNWKSQGEKGVFIAAGEIQSIEIWPNNS